MPPETRRCYSRMQSRCQSRIPQELQAESKSPNAWCPLPRFGNTYALPGSCLNAARQRLVDFSTQSTTFGCQMSILTPLLLSPSWVASCIFGSDNEASGATDRSQHHGGARPFESFLRRYGRQGLWLVLEQRPLRVGLRRSAGCEVRAATGAAPDRRPGSDRRLAPYRLDFFAFDFFALAFVALVFVTLVFVALTFFSSAFFGLAVGALAFLTVFLTVFLAFLALLLPPPDDDPDGGPGLSFCAGTGSCIQKSSSCSRVPPGFQPSSGL